MGHSKRNGTALQPITLDEFDRQVLRANPVQPHFARLTIYNTCVDEILKDPHYRRLFYWVVLLAGALLFVLRFLIQSSPRLTGWDFVAVMIDKLLSSLLVTVFVGSFVFWLTPKVMQAANLESIRPSEIGPLLQHAMVGSDTWHFRGGTGRYTRAVTLPKMAEAARQTSMSRRVEIQLLNPDDNNVCQRYADYRNGLSSANREQESWTLQRVRKESLRPYLLRMRSKSKSHISIFPSIS